MLRPGGSAACRRHVRRAAEDDETSAGCVDLELRPVRLDLANLDECAFAEVARVRVTWTELFMQLGPGDGHLWPAHLGQRMYFAGEPGVEVAGQRRAYQMAQRGHAQWDATSADFGEEPRVELNEEGGGRAVIYGVKPEGCATGEGGIQQHACPGID